MKVRELLRAHAAKVKGVKGRRMPRPGRAEAYHLEEELEG